MARLFSWKVFCQAKEDGTSPAITKDVLNIAQYLLDADEIDVPPPPNLTELRTTQRIPNMSRAIVRSNTEGIYSSSLLL